METTRIDMDPAKARELYRAYKAHRHYSEPIDWEVQRTYQLLAQGKLVIKALESIVAAGVDAQGRPKLAITRADAKAIRAGIDSRHRVWMLPEGPLSDWDGRLQGQRFNFVIPGAKASSGLQAIVPTIPLFLRPKRGLANYHILWEADWQEVPHDPMLLRRIGKGDLWLVCAHWDLTDVERAALQSRVGLRN